MTQFSLKKGCLSGSTLKIIAIIAMAIDHFAASIILYGILMQQNPSFLGHPVSMTISWWNIYQVMRFIGRIGFPVFCFLLIEGFLHTSSKKKYATRLFLFALVSEFPFDYALFNTPFAPGYQNVFFTLFLGLLTIWAIDTVSHKEINPNLQWIVKILIAAAGCLTAWLLQTDYDYKGIILILYTLPVPRSEVPLHPGLLPEPPLGSPRLPRLHPDQPLQRETWHLPEIFLLPLLPGTPFTVRFDPSLLFSELMA